VFASIFEGVFASIFEGVRQELKGGRQELKRVANFKERLF
jgi:hypothetical protein